MAQAFTIADLRGSDLHFLLDFVWAGQTLRLAEQALTDVPAGEDGADVDYHAGLEWGGSLDDLGSLLAEDVERRSVSMTLHLWPFVNVPHLTSEGHVLGSATGTFRVWAEGSDAVLTLLVGEMNDPIWGAREDPIVTTLEERPLNDRTLWPPRRARVNATSWPNRDHNLDGEYYPWVFGGPWVDDNTSSFTPAYQIDTTGNGEILIAGHRVLGGEVRIVNHTTGAVAQLTVAHQQDGYGRTIAYVVPGTPNPLAINIGDQLYCNWRDSTGPVQAFGLESQRDRTQPLRGAGDVLVFWLQQSTIRWDAGRVNAIRDRLNVYKIDTFAKADPAQRIVPFQWIQDNLLPLLPITPRIGPDGLYFVFWNYSATAEQAVADLVEGRTCWRESDVQTTPRDDVANEITVNYRQNLPIAQYLERLVFTGSEATLANDDDAKPSMWSRRSDLAYGTIAMDIKADHVTDSSTAGRILAYQLRRYAIQLDTISYSVEREIAGRLNPGDVVTLTDSDLDYTDRVCLVLGRQWSADGPMMMELQTATNNIGTPA